MLENKLSRAGVGVGGGGGGQGWVGAGLMENKANSAFPAGARAGAQAEHGNIYMYSYSLQSLPAFTWCKEIDCWYIGEESPVPRKDPIPFLNSEPGMEQMKKLMEELITVNRRAKKSKTHCKLGAKQKVSEFKQFKILGILEEKKHNL